MARFVHAALLLLAACTPARTPITLGATLTIMCGDPVSRPCCSAFAIGGKVLTAAHCVDSSDVRLVTWDDWHNTASRSQVTHTLAVDEAHDQATLEGVGGGLSAGIAQVAPGDTVWVLTRRGALRGTVQDLGGAFATSDLDIIRGDSGSPVLDDQGRAVGVIHACLVKIGSEKCLAHTGIFSTLR